MSTDINIIWQRGDNELPEKAKYVVEQARDELLLRALQLPDGVIDTIRYNADKNNQTVNGYLSSIVVDRLKTA